MSAQTQTQKKSIHLGGVINWKKILYFLPKNTDLIYIDYRGSFDECHQEIQDSIQSGNWEAIDNAIDFNDSQWEGIKYVIKELRSDLEDHWSEDQVEEALEKYDDQIRNYCYEKDTSNPIKDLCRNTGDMVMFYDTGYEVEGESWSWGKAKLRLERYLLKKHLGIVNTTMYDQRIEEMLENASYGGQLVVYFHGDIQNLIFEKGTYNTVRFKNAHIAIINTYNGSGYNTELNKSEFSLPFDAERIFVEKTIKYNYTYSVCGMSSDWCSDTIVSFSKVEGEIKELPVSDLAAIQERDKAFAAKWNKGKGECSFGDMDIRRHKNTPYTNDYPCGNTCTSCGTFWID
ncbi:MAG: hypothetical protein KA270_17405 [Saprospiraceae bacterium]|nr:hypothetical protein [Saprospiraceae bacterium]MBP6568956.1 hypothetical protein [Saprospiraceae bacterium]